MSAPLYPCPCCGHLVFQEPPGSYDICPICWWEDDLVQLAEPSRGGGANRSSLVEAQRVYAEHGWCEERVAPYVRPPRDDDERAEDWRPLDPARDTLGPADGPRWIGSMPNLDLLYYWRRDGPRRPLADTETRMEFRPTPPPPPLASRDDDELLEDLCIALRNVGVFGRWRRSGTSWEPDNDRIEGHIDACKAIHAELTRREVSVDERIVLLSEQTGWNMVGMLRDALAYPARIPWVRSLSPSPCAECGGAVPVHASIPLCEQCLPVVQRRLASTASSAACEECAWCERPPLPSLPMVATKGGDCFCEECIDGARRRYGLSSPTDRSTSA